MSRMSRSVPRSNDSTSSGGLLSYELVSGPAAGTLVFNADGSFTYTPDADDFGDYSFEYKVIDTASGEEAQRTATLSIASVNDDPDGGAPLVAALSEDDVSPTVIDLLDGAPVLDIGCGGGHTHSRFLAYI